MRAQKQANENATKATASAAAATEAREKAQANEAIAKREEIKSREVATFLKDMLKGVGPSVALGRDTEMLKEILDRTAARLDEDLKAQPEVEAELRHTIGGVFKALDDRLAASEMFGRALQLRKQVYGDEHTLVAETLIQVAKCGRHGDASKTIEMLRRALEMRERLLGPEDLDVSKSLTAIASHYNHQSKGAEAEPFWRRAVAIQRKHLDDSSTGSLLGLAASIEQQERYDEAAEVVREARGVWSKRDDDEHRQRVAQCDTLLGRICTKQQRYEVAEEHLGRAIDVFESIDVPNIQYLFAIQTMVSALRTQDKLHEAEQWQQENIRLASRIFGKESGWASTELIKLGRIQVEQENWDDATSSLEMGLQLREPILPNGDGWTKIAMEALEKIESRKKEDASAD